MNFDKRLSNLERRMIPRQPDELPELDTAALLARLAAIEADPASEPDPAYRESMLALAGALRDMGVIPA